LEQAALFPQIQIEQKFLYEHEHLIMGISFALAKSARVQPAIHDQDLMGALTSMSSSQETLVNSGLHYEAHVPSPAQQALIAEVHSMLKQYRETEHQHLGYNRLRDSDVLRALVFLLRMAHTRTSGRPKSRAFVDFLSDQFPAQTPTAAASSIIIP
jgi:hypothetical protein